jgi:hypothetical protein
MQIFKYSNIQISNIKTNIPHPTSRTDVYLHAVFPGGDRSRFPMGSATQLAVVLRERSKWATLRLQIKTYGPGFGAEGWGSGLHDWLKVLYRERVLAGNQYVPLSNPVYDRVKLEIRVEIGRQVLACDNTDSSGLAAEAYDMYMFLEQVTIPQILQPSRGQNSSNV